MNTLTSTVLIGIGATVVMDIWSWLRTPLLGIPPPDYGLVGRWLGHMPQGRFRHIAITQAQPLHGERLIGWLAHYLIGIAYAGVLIGIWGHEWIAQPTPGPALVVGLVTVAAPFLLMQPGMGAGIAAARTPRPNAVRLQSLITHAVFGLGLYLSAWTLQVLHLT